MKYLVLFGILLVIYLIWRHTRVDRGDDSDHAAPPPARPPAGAPQDMVQCPVCSVHLPRGDAVTGSNGLLYCSNEHRLRAER